MLVTSIFSFSHNVFCAEREIIISAPFILSSENSFNLDQSKILPFGKELRAFDQYFIN